MPADLIDRSQLDLICEECAGEVADIFREFVEEFPIHFLELRLLAVQRDGAALAKTAHRIKGSSATFGLSRFAELLRAIERGADTGWLPGDPELAEIERTFAESIQQIRAWRPELS